MSTMYTPLKTSRREIRLISICSDLHKHDGSNMPRGSIADGTLMCTMKTVSLKDWTSDYAAFRAKAIDWPYSPTTLYEEWEHFSREKNGYMDDDTPTPDRFVWGDYETISYTWENGSNTQHTIYVNDRPFLIQDNLYHALQEFRGSKDFVEGRKRMLWADAICINQNNLDERATEVKRMKEIFSTATRSTVWLGPSLEVKGIDTEPYFDLVGRLIDHLCPSTFTDDSSTDDLQPTSTDLALSKTESPDENDQEDYESRALSEEAFTVISQFDPAERPPIPALAKLSANERLLALLFPILRLSYWTRAWIIQELIVSSSQTILRAGSSQISFARLHWFSDCFHKATTFDERWSPDERYSGTIVNALLLLNTVCEIQLGLQPPKLRASPETSLILRGLMSRSSLPLDKLYGVLGLLQPATHLGIDVDYRKTPRQGSIDASIALIRAAKAIKTFDVCRDFQSSEVPSWTVNLRVDQDPTSSIERYFWKRNPVAIPEVDWEVFWERQVGQGDQGILSLRGKYLHTVDGVAACVSVERADMETSFQESTLVRRLVFSMTEPTRLRHSYADDSEMFAHLDAIIHGFPNWIEVRSKDKYHARASPEVSKTSTSAVSLELDSDDSPGSKAFGVSVDTATTLSPYKQFVDASADFMPWKDQLSSFFTGVGEKPGPSISTSGTSDSIKILDTDRSTALGDKLQDVNLWGLHQVRLITTMSGYLGVAAQLAEQGDVVYAVEGYGCPVILRPIENADTFEFIGLAEVWSPAVSGTWKKMAFDCIVRLQ